MENEQLIPVNEEDLLTILVGLKNVRAEASLEDRDPWAFRQALITVLDIDTATALECGIPVKSLKDFDARAREKSQEFIKASLEEVIGPEP